MELEWESSVTCRKHWVNDGFDMHKHNDDYFHLFEIINLTPLNHYNQREKEGYDLLHKGKKVSHAKTVKELKEKAESIK
ncbi:MAG: hypothetical protein KAS30_01615 [Candidatus Diapherotrites archaeon]|nr:hypothetical protein [Candidatus Diapherotrites archaeon]